MGSYTFLTVPARDNLTQNTTAHNLFMAQKLTLNELKMELLLLATGHDLQTLAEKAEIDRTTVGKHLSGKRKSKTTKNKIADVLCEGVRDLLDNTETAPT